MHVTPATVRAVHAEVRARPVAETINAVRAALGEAFGVSVGTVRVAQYRAEVDRVFADGDRAVNVATLYRLLQELDVEADYPGFVVDEFLGRRLAATIAGGQPLALLAEATFHYADIHIHDHAETDAGAGADDLEAALAAGFQSRLPGWPWTETPSPFAVDTGTDADAAGGADDEGE